MKLGLKFGHCLQTSKLGSCDDVSIRDHQSESESTDAEVSSLLSSPSGFFKVQKSCTTALQICNNVIEFLFSHFNCCPISIVPIQFPNLNCSPNSTVPFQLLSHVKCCFISMLSHFNCNCDFNSLSIVVSYQMFHFHVVPFSLEFLFQLSHFNSIVATCQMLLHFHVLSRFHCNFYFNCSNFNFFLSKTLPRISPVQEDEAQNTGTNFQHSPHSSRSVASPFGNFFLDGKPAGNCRQLIVDMSVGLFREKKNSFSTRRGLFFK